MRIKSILLFSIINLVLVFLISIVGLIFNIRKTADIGVDIGTLKTDYVKVVVTYNTAPTITSVSESTDPIEEGTTQTITPSGQADEESNDLHIYCCQDTNDTCTPTTSNTCNNDQAWSSPYSSMTCTLTVPSVSSATTYYARCRVYDNSLYSSTTASTNYTIKQSNGDTCTSGSDCISSNCVDGYCCDTTCTEECEACNLSGYVGTCQLFCASTPILPPISTTGQGNISEDLGGEIKKIFESGQWVKIVFPPYSIKGTVVATIEPQDKDEKIETNPLPENFQITGDLIADLIALSEGEELESFEKETSIIFSYSDDQIKEASVNENTLKIYFWDENTSSWQALESEIDLNINTITAHTSHLTLFSVMGEVVEEPIIEETEEPISEMNLKELLNEIIGALNELIQLHNQLIGILKDQIQF